MPLFCCNHSEPHHLPTQPQGQSPNHFTRFPSPPGGSDSGCHAFRDLTCHHTPICHVFKMQNTLSCLLAFAGVILLPEMSPVCLACYFSLITVLQKGYLLQAAFLEHSVLPSARIAAPSLPCSCCWYVSSLVTGQHIALIAQSVKNLPAVQETRVQFLGWEDALEKEMATHSGILAWRIPWTEEPGGLQSMGSQESDTT